MHFFQSGNLYTRPDVADFNAVVPYAKEVARNKAHLASVFKVWLASGVTSVVDVGGPFWNFDVRDEARKPAAAPRVDVEIIPSIAGKNPVEAHSFVGNEAVVVARTAAWLDSIGLPPG